MIKNWKNFNEDVQLGINNNIVTILNMIEEIFEDEDGFNIIDTFDITNSGIFVHFDDSVTYEEIKNVADFFEVEVDMVKRIYYNKSIRIDINKFIDKVSDEFDYIVDADELGML